MVWGTLGSQIGERMHDMPDLKALAAANPVFFSEIAMGFDPSAEYTIGGAPSAPYLTVAGKITTVYNIDPLSFELKFSHHV